MASRIKIEPYRPPGVGMSAIADGGSITFNAPAGDFGESLAATEASEALQERLARDNEAAVKSADASLASAEQALLFDPQIVARLHRAAKCIMEELYYEYTLIDCTMTDQPPKLPDLPPLDPAGEREVQGHEEFVSNCREMARSVIGDGGQLGTEMVTESERWSIVWRADLKSAEGDFPPLVNRVVCWNAPSGTLHIEIAMFHDIPALRDVEAQ